MDLFFEVIKFIVYSIIIVLISKYALVVLLRKIAETLNLKPKTIGNISGVATSIPELITVSLSSFTGLNGASLYNIISSNIINFIQYIITIILNKNGKVLKNKAILIDIFLVITTIVIPLILVKIRYINSITVIIFAILFILYYSINIKTHKKYLKKIENRINEEQEKIIKQEEKEERRNNYLIPYIIYLIIVLLIIFLVGNRLSNVLENLCYILDIPQVLVGIALGFTTSIPELITFFEAQRKYRNTNKSDQGVVEATNNLLTSNIINLFIIQSVGIIIILLE